MLFIYYIVVIHWIRFSHYLAGEDGQIKIWSKSGMLRSTLASQGKAIAHGNECNLC